MEDQEPIVPFPASASAARPGDRPSPGTRSPPRVTFDRRELNTILDLYGRHVAAGEWRDYALDFGREAATFSIFRHTSEMPLYRVVKDPALARRQGMYAVIAQGGLILKRGHDLAQVLRVLVKRPKLASL